MNTKMILNGLVLVQIGCNPQEVLDRLKEQQAQEKIACKNNIEQAKNDHKRRLAQQQINTKTPKQSRDHSSSHDASRQYAGSRRR